MSESGRDCLVCAIRPQSGLECLICAVFAHRFALLFRPGATRTFPLKRQALGLTAKGLEFGVQALGFRVWGLRFGVQGSGFGV